MAVIEPLDNNQLTTVVVVLCDRLYLNRVVCTSYLVDTFFRALSLQPTYVLRRTRTTYLNSFFGIINTNQTIQSYTSYTVQVSVHVIIHALKWQQIIFNNSGAHTQTVVVSGTLLQCGHTCIPFIAWQGWTFPAYYSCKFK